MKIYGKANLHDLFGKNIIFRKLNILDKSLPQYKDIERELSISDFPRKNSRDYAKVITYLINKLNPESTIIIYFGDSNLDKIVVENLRSVSNKTVKGFIFNERERAQDDQIFNFNNWEDLSEFPQKIEEEIHPGWFGLFDLDKTVIGARSRNSQPIDSARFEAVLEIMQQVSPEINKKKLKQIYDYINTQCISLTEDNQDYVACLTIWIYFQALEMDTLKQFSNCGKNIGELFTYIKKGNIPDSLYPYFKEIYWNYSQEQSPLFKSFRYAELRTTARKFNLLKNENDIQKILTEEITITKEIFDVINLLKQNAIKFLCISDKPDETIFPESPDKAGLIFSEAKIVGKEISDRFV